MVGDGWMMGDGQINDVWMVGHGCVCVCLYGNRRLVFLDAVAIRPSMPFWPSSHTFSRALSLSGFDRIPWISWCQWRERGQGKDDSLTPPPSP